MDKVLTSEITLIIYYRGILPILNVNFYSEPNNVKRNECKKYYNLESGNSVIKLQFNGCIISCEYMCFELSNIMEIDLSRFVFSQVRTMKSMFQACTNLKNIKFGN